MASAGCDRVNIREKSTYKRAEPEREWNHPPWDDGHLDPPATIASHPDAAPPRVGWFAATIGTIGAWIIYRLIWIFGRTYRWNDIPWLAGPLGKREIGEAPHGNATVLLRPELGDGGSLILDSSGKRFGDPGFYRLHARRTEQVRVWHVRSLKEKFHVYVDAEGTLRCDHAVQFLGLPVLRLHYKIFRLSAELPIPGNPAAHA